MAFVIHLFDFAEVYAVLLSWITLPLGYGACFYFFQRHFGMFLPVAGPKE